jgi:hypothetical protein
MLAILCLMLLGGSLTLAQQRHDTSGSLPLPVTNAAVTEGDPIGRPFYRYGYYLFLADAPHGCEDCYVPLLITPEPLERIARGQAKAEGVWIITYERDSIWQMDGTVDLSSGSIEAPARRIHLKGRTYRYQEVQAAAVLKLLRNPMGSIPISRPFVPNKVARGANLEELISDFRTLFRVRERRPGSIATGRAGTSMSAPVFISLLTVLEDGKVEYRFVPDCLDRLHWNCPDRSSEKLFRYEMAPTQLSELKTLLERQEVKLVSDFMNAAPIFHDYDVEIPRSEEVQDIQVLAFMPGHIELQQHPALLHLICKAKEIERLASSSQETPGWCKTLPPLQ